MSRARALAVAAVLCLVLAALGVGPALWRARPAAGPGARPGAAPPPAQPRRPAVRFWAAETDGWDNARPASRRLDFPDYDAPVSPNGFPRSRKRTSKYVSGTAFAIDDHGRWLTARHVVDRCSAVLVQAGVRDGRRASLAVVRIRMHPMADVAVLETRRPEQPIEPLAVVPVFLGAAEAYHVGFPRSKPGAVHSVFLGYKQVRRGYNRRRGEQVVVWAEKTRIPDYSGSLGGMSGGAVLDRFGTAMGTSSVEMRRRGRILTSRPEALWETLGADGAAPGPPDHPAAATLTPDSYPRVAKRLIQSGRVARVLCRVRKE